MPIFANNSSSTTVRGAFQTYAAGTATIRLVSPFFSYADLIDDLAKSGRTVALIVRLGEATSPRDLRQALSNPNVKVRFYTSRKFHTKLYIFGDKCALIGSANLTESGLQSNREAVITVFPLMPEFDQLVGLFETYWAQAEVLNERKLDTYESLCRRRPPDPGARPFQNELIASFGDTLPAEGVQTGGRRLSSDKLYLKDYERSYQEFLQAYREVEALYNEFGLRKTTEVPLRIEVDQFFNFLRDKHCRGNDFEVALVQPAEVRRNTLNQLLQLWAADPWPYLGTTIVPNYSRINDTMGSRTAIDNATHEDILHALEVCHAFKDQLRFHHGGTPTMRAEFLRDTTLSQLRKTFKMLLHGDEPIVMRMGSCMRDPPCLKCGGDLCKGMLADQWVWTCQNGCNQSVFTGVHVKKDIRPFEAAAIPDGRSLNTGAFGEPLVERLVPGAKVYMPFILYHFIGCTWGTCYVMLFQNVIQPHLDCVDALEYVLKTRVVSDEAVPPYAPKMYAELYTYLNQVKSPAVREYVRTQFGARFDKAV
jgi:hypothetical protein